MRNENAGFQLLGCSDVKRIPRLCHTWQWDDLAIAAIIGGAFGKIITALVKDVLMPLVDLVPGGVNFSEWAVTAGIAVVTWDAFVQPIIDFIFIAFMIFLRVRAMNRLRREEPVTPATEDCPHYITTIPLKAARCPNCTSQL